ncbi:hypothetical protein N658DRAFT_503019 [Parathielavia hyrcaniae]|uniref:Aminoglycoside phosphotransferase domain-containing protein n=1 Tax=Parathielavia hyrcaniae TaxID=113614 RepID=A0AAN6T799_9PEZI|nr:hypothetical protein N658DRAFT_503019 [Parathielavia hyrcaniae]
MNSSTVTCTTRPAFPGGTAPGHVSTTSHDPLGVASNDPLSLMTRLVCRQFARTLYPSANIVEPPEQGRCSYTLLLPDDGIILQFRPPTHCLDLDITAAASAFFPDLAPATTSLWAVIDPATVLGRHHDLLNDNDIKHQSHHLTSPASDSDRTLFMYSQTHIDGVPLSSLLLTTDDPHRHPRRQQEKCPLTLTLLTDSETQLASLLRSLARDYFARSYRHPAPWVLLDSPCPAEPSSSPPPLSPSSLSSSSLTPSSSSPRAPQTHEAAAAAASTAETANEADIITTGGVLLTAKRRRVGQTLRERMQWMRRDLPSRFSSVLEQVRDAMDEIERCLPWVLTHGDLGAGNVLVDLDLDGLVRLKGLVDWAEGEWLPFGVGLYGLEEMLGRRVENGSGTGRARFEYYPYAERLRGVFWDELVAAVPELGADQELRARVEKARLLGLLLWHGIAFDDGALNRVVEPGLDDEELQKLDLFLMGIDHHKSSTASAPVPDEAGIFSNWPLRSDQPRQESPLDPQVPGQRSPSATCPRGTTTRPLPQETALQGHPTEIPLRG